MWKKRACSVLLALMVAMTAIPLSAVPVYAQETVQNEINPETGEQAESAETEGVDASESDGQTEGEDEALKQEAAEAGSEEALEDDDSVIGEESENEADTDDESAVSDDQSQEAEESEDKAASSDEASGEEDAAADSGKVTDLDQALPSVSADGVQTPDGDITAEPALGTLPLNAADEGKKGDEGGSIWFDINDGRIFSDKTYSFDLHTEDIPEAYDVQVTVGHYDDSGLVEAYTKGKEYDFDGSKLTLHGDKIYQKGYHWFGMETCQKNVRQNG